MKFIKRKSAVKPITGSIVDTTNIDDKSKNTYSARVIDSLVGSGGGADISQLADMFYPIGRGFLDFTDTDYSNWLGLTWERELVGMTPIGKDANDTDYNEVGKTGGKKTLTLSKANLPSYTLYNATHGHGVTDNGHTHNIPVHNSSNGSSSGISSEDASQSSGVNHYVASASAKTGISIKTATIKVDSGGSGEAVDLRTPYKVVSYWKRIA